MMIFFSSGPDFFSVAHLYMSEIETLIVRVMITVAGLIYVFKKMFLR
jgi:hypothetical protein